MNEAPQSLALLVFLIGTLIVVALIVRSGMNRISAPALIGFIGIGILLRLAEDRWSLLGDQGYDVLEVLAGIGIVALLFRVGLESNLAGLRRPLPAALPIWAGNVGVAGLLGFATAYWPFGIALVPSLFVAVALTATSVGVSVSVWQDANALDSDNGRLLIDVAEMDDVSGVALMALLLAVAPVLLEDSQVSLLSVLGSTGLSFAAKFAAFAGFCYLLGRFVERRFTAYWRRILTRTDMTILTTSIGIMIAAGAEWLGLSLAIGALFAGFVFSPDRAQVEESHAYGALIDLFTPFFFISIGLSIAPNALFSALAMGVPLAAIAIFGKLVGTAAPALRRAGWAGAILLGVSMVPRAEISMIVMQRGYQQGYISEPVFGAAVVVAAFTCIAAPLALQRLLRRWPQNGRGGPRRRG